MTANNVCPNCGGVSYATGRLRITLTPDDRLLLFLHTDKKGGAWLELLPADIHFLGRIIDFARYPANMEPP